MPRSTPLIALGVVVLVGALALGAHKARQLRAARATFGWPAAAGQVVESKLETVRSTSRRRATTTYLVALRDTYTVDGQPYTGDRFSATALLGDFSSTDAGRAGEVLRRYPRGAAVTVIYDPRRPGAAVLERGGFGAGEWPQLLGLAPLLGGPGAWFVRLGRARPTARPAPAPLARPAWAPATAGREADAGRS